MSEAQRIADSLSEAQRRALLRAEPDGHLGHHFVRWWHANAPTLKALRRAGMGTTVWSGLALTPLGLEVKAYLQQKEPLK